MIKQKVTNDVFYREYSQDLTDLSDKEKKLVAVLCEICKLTGRLYEIQTDSGYPGANLYPKDITRDELERASKSDLQVLNRYTVVKRDGNLLKAVPFHIEYKDIFSEIIPLLENAISISKLLDGYESMTKLLSVSRDAMKGKLGFEYVLDAYTKERGTKVEFYFGPLVSYADRLFHKKKVFESGVCIKSRKNYCSEEYIQVAVKTLFSRGSLNVENPPKVNIRIDEVVCFGGGNAEMLISQANMYSFVDPTSIKVGTFVTGAKHKYFERMKPVKDKMFSPKLNERFDDEIMQDASVRYSLLDGISEVLTRSHYPMERLEDSYWAFQELHGDALAVSIAGIHMLTGATTEEEYRSIVFVQILRAVSDYIAIPNALEGIDSSTGKSVILSRLFETGALSKYRLDGKLYIDFHKAYKVYEDISNETIEIVISGDSNLARNYLAKYSDLGVYKKFI